MLHGEIKVNDIVVGDWTAVRAEQVALDVHMYDCTVKYRNLAGYPLRGDFRVRHRYSNGAVALSAHILSEAGYHLKPVRMSDAGFGWEHV